MTATNNPNGHKNIDELPMSQTLEVKDFVSQNYLRNTEKSLRPNSMSQSKHNT